MPHLRDLLTVSSCHFWPLSLTYLWTQRGLAISLNILHTYICMYSIALESVFSTAPFPPPITLDINFIDFRYSFHAFYVCGVSKTWPNSTSQHTLDASAARRSSRAGATVDSGQGVYRELRLRLCQWQCQAQWQRHMPPDIISRCCCCCPHSLSTLSNCAHCASTTPR